MPFSTTGSIVSTDLDNMLRGLNRNNSDIAVSGPVVETNLSSFSVAANTIGATGALFVLAAGSSVGAGGTKLIKFYLGSTVLIQTSVPAGNQCWFVKAWIYNTATNAQRCFIESGYIGAVVGSSATPVLNYSYATSAIDTTANQTVKVTTTNANAGDTCTESMFDVYVAQIT